MILKWFIVPHARLEFATSTLPWRLLMFEIKSLAQRVLLLYRSLVVTLLEEKHFFMSITTDSLKPIMAINVHL